MARDHFLTRRSQDLPVDTSRRTSHRWRGRPGEAAGEGAIIINESSGASSNHKHFRREWRNIATAAGIPKNIQNGDSRPGAATEADLAGAPKGKTQHMLRATPRRDDFEVNSELARLRVEKRKP